MIFMTKEIIVVRSLDSMANQVPLPHIGEGYIITF